VTIGDHRWQTWVMPEQHVSTEVAAKEIGVAYRTLLRWARAGKVTPAMYTPGGQFRWDLANLKQQLADRKPKADDT
jgi:predicted site-specific integrase-resolvase